MTIEAAISARHSVRQYKDTPLFEEQVIALLSNMEQINRDRGLHIQLIQK